MAKFTVDTNVAVFYDGENLYHQTAAYTVLDTLENYQKSLVDVAAGLITITEAFTDSVATGEQYLTVTADLSKAAWNTVATHELLGITGLVKVKLLAEVLVDGDDTTGNTSTIQLGFKGATNALIAATQVDDLATGELWYDATPTTLYDTTANAVIERVVNSLNIGYEVAGEAATAGKIKFHCWWTPLNMTGNVSAGAGAAMV